MRIKKKDKWKVAFITPEESFELIVMFFGLINPLAMFQTIINKLLKDLINTRKIGNFINDVMVRTESEEEYDELVEEILRRMEKQISI